MVFIQNFGLVFEDQPKIEVEFLRFSVFFLILSLEYNVTIILIELNAVQNFLVSLASS